MTPIYNYVLIITFTDLSTVPVRLAVKSYFDILVHPDPV